MAGLLMGCMVEPPTDMLLRRASFDLACPTGQLVVLDLGGRTRRVSGCGRNETYLFYRTEWLSNSP